MINADISSVNYQMRIPASLSIFGSSFMMLTYLIFPNIRSFKYFELLFYVAINDYIASIGLLLGNVPSGSVACWLQGILTNYHFLASIAWTSVLSYELYLVILHQQKLSGFINYRYIHIFCWGFPLFPTFLPLTTNDYGKFDDQNESWCFLDDRSDSPSWGNKVWTILGFYLWIWIAIVCVAYMYVQIQRKLRSMTISLHDPSNTGLKTIVGTLSYYPVLLMICWSCTSIIGVFTSFSSSRNRAIGSLAGGIIIDMLGTILPALQGFLHSIIFFSRSQVVRIEWLFLIKQIFGNIPHQLKDQMELQHPSHHHNLTVMMGTTMVPFQNDSSFFGTITDSMGSIGGLPADGSPRNGSMNSSRGRSIGLTSASSGHGFRFTSSSPPSTYHTDTSNSGEFS